MAVLVLGLVTFFNGYDTFAPSYGPVVRRPDGTVPIPPDHLANLEI
jgi:hypothetical protein